MMVRVFLAAACLFSCSTKYIPTTFVKDTDENRAVYAVMEEYRQAMEARDLLRLLGLVSKDYFESRGTSDPQDDYGFDKLKQKLEEDFKTIKAVRLDLILKTIEVEADKAVCTYHYFLRYQVELPTGDEWKPKEDDARMAFRKEGGEWKMVSGL